MDKLLTYKGQVIEAMRILAEDPRTIFIGQTVRYPGSAIYDTLEAIPMEKRIEVPVFEDTQMGMAIGLSLEGYIPVSIYPRFDFLLLAVNQLVNHLDKIGEMSCGQFKPKVIIRTMVGSTKPLYPGIQHCSDYTQAFVDLLRDTHVIKLYRAESIVSAYVSALYREGSTLLIEMADLYAQDSC